MISEDTRWLDDPDLSRHYQPMIERLCSQYLILESKRSFALDPVGNFHLRNGAAIHQLNWRADTLGMLLRLDKLLLVWSMLTFVFYDYWNVIVR